MQQLIFSERLCLQHPEKKVIYLCLDKSCPLNRLVCLECAKYHSIHFQNLLTENKFEIQIKESLNSQQQCIELVENFKTEINIQLEKIIQSFVAKYNVSIEQMNQMQNKEFHENICNIVYFEEETNYLNQLFERRINQMKELANNYFNKSLKDLQQKEINLQNMEKVENYYLKGKKYFDKNDQKSAINMFDEALKINQNHIQSFSSKGESLASIGSFKESIECYDKAISIMDVQYKQLQYNKGFSLRMLGQYKESIDWFDKALTIDPNYKEALCGKGDSLLMLHKYKDSVVWFDKSLAIDPKYKQALQGKGDALRMQEKYSEAIKYFDSALLIDSQYGMSLGSKGACLLQLGKLDEAEQCLNQAIQLNPKHEFNHFQLKLLEQKKKK